MIRKLQFYSLLSMILLITASVLAQDKVIVDRSALSDIPSANTMSAAESYKISGSVPYGISPSSEPHITVFANPEGSTLQTVELLLYSSDDCIPFCSSSPNTDPRVAYFGTYVFEHYTMNGNIKTHLADPFEFTIDQSLIDHNPNILLYENPNDADSPVLRRLILNLSGKGITPPSDTHSYVSVKFIASPSLNPFEPSLERTVSILYSKYMGENEVSGTPNISQSDHISYVNNSGITITEKVSSKGHVVLSTGEDTLNTYYRFAAKYSLGHDIPSNSYIISTCEQLNDIDEHDHEYVSFINESGIIDCEHSSVSTLNLNTAMTLDGNGIRIRNLTIDGPALFHTLKAGSHIKNIIFEDVFLNDSSEAATGLIASTLEDTSNSASTILENIHVTGEVSRILGGTRPVGGLIGLVPQTASLIIKDSSVSANVHGTGSHIGGLVGRAFNTQILRSSFTGDVSTRLPMAQWGAATGIGGLIGLGYQNITIEQSFATGLVQGLWSSGGLVGIFYNDSIIRDSYFDGHVQGMQSSDPESGRGLGGLVGLMANAKITRSYANGKISGRSALGGLVGKASENTTVMDSFSTSEIEIYPFEGENPFNPVGTAGSIAGEVESSLIQGSSFVRELPCVHQLDGFPKSSSITQCNETTLTHLKSVAHSTDWDIRSVWENLEYELPTLRNVARAPSE